MINNRFINMSFRTKLFIAYITVVIFSMVIFGVTMFSNFAKKFEAERVSNTSQITKLAVDNTTNAMDNIEYILNSVQSNSVIQKIISTNSSMSYSERSAIIENELLSIDPLRATVSELHIYIENSGYYPASSDSLVTSSEYAENESWYQKAMGMQGRIYWTIMDTSDINGKLCAARALIDTNTHEFLGIIRANINLSQFTTDLAHISIDNQGKLFLVFNNHIVNTWKDSYINGFVNEPTFFDAISSDVSEPQIIEINNIKHIINHEKIKNTELFLVYASNYSDVNKDTYIIATSILLSGFSLLVLAMLFIFLFTRWLTAPIAKLTAYMKKFETDRVRVPIDIESKDEIGELCNSYNSMLQTIDSLISDVKSLYKKQKIFELKALQAQINPHFLYNTLDSIHWMARSHHATDISKMVAALGTFFRHSLNKGNEYTTLENELKQIQSYTDIQKVRFEDKFTVNYDIDEDLLKCTIIKLTIQPLVENSILHGFEEIDEGGIINIKAYSDSGYIYIEVADNGCGTDTDALNTAIQSDIDYNEPIEKFGLTNVNLRIKLYFDDTCGLLFKTNEDGGVTAVIKIRQIKHETKTIDL